MKGMDKPLLLLKVMHLIGIERRCRLSLS